MRHTSQELEDARELQQAVETCREFEDDRGRSNTLRLTCGIVLGTIAGICLLAILLALTGCASTRIEIPARWVTPDAAPDAAPAVYSSSKNVSIEVTSPGVTVRIIGDAATVNQANASGTVAILDASGGVIQSIPLSALAK